MFFFIFYSCCQTFFITNKIFLPFLIVIYIQFIDLLRDPFSFSILFLFVVFFSVCCALLLGKKENQQEEQKEK